MALLQNTLNKNTSPVVSKVTDEATNNNQSIVLPGAFGKNNNLGQATNNQNESTAITPGATKEFTTPKETAKSTYEAPLQTYPGLASSISSALSTPSYSQYSIGSFNDYQHEFPTYNELQEALGPTYEAPANADIESTVPTAANPTNTPFDALNKWNRTRNLLDATSVGSQRAWNVIQNQPKAEQTAVQNSLRNDTDLGLLGAEAVRQQWGRDNNIDAYNTYARLMAAGESPEYAAEVATEQYPVSEDLYGPFASPLQEEIKEKAGNAQSNFEKQQAELQSGLEEIEARDDATYAMISQAGYGVDTSSAFDEYCNDNGLDWFENDPDYAFVDFQLYASYEEWHDWVRNYPSLYSGYDEFAYDDNGNPYDIYSMDDATFDACFEAFWNHYKPITVDQYFDFEDEAGNFSYGGTTTLDTLALFGYDEDVMQQWANLLETNEWWNSESLYDLVDKYSNDENYDFAINSNGYDELSNLEQSNAQAWLLTLFANAEQEARLKAKQAREERADPNSVWLEQPNGQLGLNFSQDYLTGENGFNNSTYWLNPNMLFLGDETGQDTASFADRNLYDINDTTNFTDLANNGYGTITNEFSPVEWAGPNSATYNNYTMRNEGKAFEGIPYWTSEAFKYQNPTSGQSIYSYTPAYTYPENPTNYQYYNPYAYRDAAVNGQLSTSSEEEEE